jgi:hypothetical protein
MKQGFTDYSKPFEAEIFNGKEIEILIPLDQYLFEAKNIAKNLGNIFVIVSVIEECPDTQLNKVQRKICLQMGADHSIVL